MNRRQMLEFLSLSRLPSEFQEVEYLESSGTQYINTGIIAKSSINVNGLFQIKSTSIERTFGARTSAYKYENYINSQNNYFINRFFYVNEYADIRLHAPAYANYTDVLLSIKNGVCKFNTETILTNTTTFDTNLNLYLFASNNDGIAQYFGNEIRLKHFKMFDGNTIVRNFVPCYRKADNVAGLYDLVNGVFYTNAGTGTFIVGGNL